MSGTGYGGVDKNRARVMSKEDLLAMNAVQPIQRFILSVGMTLKIFTGKINPTFCGGNLNCGVTTPIFSNGQIIGIYYVTLPGDHERTQKINNQI